ncbi:putative mitochondrial protein [Trifolium repens]|nr:putative mitochondrial protein [Trifolium repens]
MPPRPAPIIVPPPTNNADSIFYVHPSEGPSSLTVTPQFNGSNYLAWSRFMRRALGAKNKLSFIDGTLPIPDEHDLNCAAWEHCNHLIHSWIIGSVSDSIAQTLVFHDTAIDAWEDLRERFAKVDRIRISTLRASLNNLKQSNKSVLDYFTDMRMLWEELNSHRPMPHCTCIHQCVARLCVLHGITILLMDPLPSMNKVYSLVIQEESNHSLHNFLPLNSIDDSDVIVNVVDTKKYQNHGKGPATSAKGKDTRHCTYCDKAGHTVDACYKKHGYPNPRSYNNANSINVEGGNGVTSNGATDDLVLIISIPHPLLTQDLKSKRMIGLGDHMDGLYKLSFNLTTPIPPPFPTLVNHTHSSPIPNTTFDCFSNLTCNKDSSAGHAQTIPTIALWHFRFGHLSHNRLSHMINVYPSITCDNKAICDVCHFAKQKKLPYASSKSHAKFFFELLHFDIWGPLAISSVHGHKYFLTIVDDFSRFVWIILLKNKFDVSTHVQSFITMIETQYRVTPKIIRSDNGPEFLLNTFFASKGILHQRSCVENPQQNGRVERKHQHILNVGRALLFQSKLPNTFWSYAVSHAVFLINRVTTSVLHQKSPYQLLYDSIPDISLYKVFGCLCFASTLSSHRTKLDPRARKSVFLGYKTGYKGYVLYDLYSNEIFISRNVTFYEHILPYTVTSPSMTKSWNYTPSFTIPQPSSTSPTTTTTLPIITPSPTPDILSTPSAHDIAPLPPTPSSTTSLSPTNPIPSTSIQPRQSTRPKTTPSYLKDYICSFITDHPSINSSGILYPLSSYHSYHNLKAMQTELSALDSTGTWLLVDRPPHVKPIGCRWVYKVKHNADGTIERYKARLVAKGYNQIEGLDYFDTYSQVAKLTTVRLVLALASINHWNLHQLDVNNAFLHGDLQEDVYMTPPPNINAKPNQVCKVVKSLYGLKQASCKWYEKLTSILVSHHYKQAPSDHSLFIKQTPTSFTILLVYVDDILLAGNSLSEFAHIKQVLNTAFKIKDLGIHKYFPCLEVAHSKSGVSLCQRKYCLDLLHDYGLSGCNPASTPSDPSIKLYNDSSPPFEDIPAYRRIVGRLLYLNTTRPDITFITQQLSQFLSSPTHTHYNAALRVLRYLKGCPGRGLFFDRSSPLHLQGFSDADWAGCKDTRRSISGQCFFLGHSLISWRTKK